MLILPVFTYDKAVCLEIVFLVERNGNIVDGKLAQSSVLIAFDGMVVR